MEGQFKKVYSKRSENWRAERVKEPKKYPHLPLLLADILRRRVEDQDAITRHIEVSPNQPSKSSTDNSYEKGPFNRRVGQS